MKKLELTQIENLQGGGLECFLACVAIGIALGPIAGVACELLCSTPAY